MTFEIISAEEVQSKNGNSYKKASIKDEGGAVISVSAWPDFSKYSEVVTGGKVEGIIRQKGTYNNLVDQLQTPGFVKDHRMNQTMEKKAENINQAQDKKADGISKAQDRSELMWARRGACEIVANHPAFKEKGINEISGIISLLTDKILGKSTRTSPTLEQPEGIDVSEIPF